MRRQSDWSLCYQLPWPLYTRPATPPRPYLEVWQCKLEVRPEVLIDVDERSRGHSHCWHARLRVVHEECLHACRQVEERCLKDHVDALVDFELHVIVTTAQVAHQEMVVSTLVQILKSWGISRVWCVCTGKCKRIFMFGPTLMPINAYLSRSHVISSAK